MTAIATQDRLITADEFERMAHRLGRSELIDGRIVTMTPTGWEHGGIELQIGMLVRLYVRKHDLGYVGTGEVGCKLPNGRVRAPDVLFVRKERLVGVSKRGFLPFAPDLAVEIVSPNDNLGDVRDKANDWIAAGSEAVWTVDPETRTVTVYGLAQTPRVLVVDDTLEGGDLLPGFACPVVEIFA